ncbi:hypothetical protein TTHERM_00289500 (macronuclear) [Tetrahymena thermophila SB210]|uniref:Uncharacterized protein n=1 Tax=Tetrahymena thermophila (strain SB210) TaxID=312017 RepID=I7MKH2_TETTS|nr:hypothetical protein TTHERM_00289500 [Tetrahymena thermophila SB210]EAR98421.2 hypothetical protein TTHERM_00289500 [Tetrahymena thermophila SB210]|eukprot:XP_001018666.2 hypothetical protein TTHERM_00289500 [Tetrahymena thermophila SB210]
MNAQAQDTLEKVFLLKEISLHDTIRQLKNENAILKTKLSDKERQIQGLVNQSQDYQRLFLKQREELLRLSLQIQEYQSEKEKASPQKFRLIEKERIDSIDQEMKQILSNKQYRNIQENQNPNKLFGQSSTNKNNQFSGSHKQYNLFLEKQEIFKKVKQHFLNEREKNLQEMYSEDFFDIVKRKKEGYLKQKQKLQERFQESRKCASPYKSNNQEKSDKYSLQQDEIETCHLTPNSSTKAFSTQSSPKKILTPYKSQKIYTEGSPKSIFDQARSEMQNKNNFIPELKQLQVSESIFLIPKNKLQILNQDIIEERRLNILKQSQEAS